MKYHSLATFTIIIASTLAIAGTIGGFRSPGGADAQCDLPAELHRRNTTSLGQGCCVWTSIHHAATWQNTPQYQDAPRWIQSHRIPGGAYPGSVHRYLPEMAKERGLEPAPYLNYQGADLDIIKLACRTGRMPCVTYSYSPTGRYGGRRIAHMVNVIHADDDYIGILDNNYTGADNIEWLTPDEFKQSWTGLGGGWAVILLTPPPPPAPRNTQ